ncbi:unnamed protein product [Alternaria alternata]
MVTNCAKFHRIAAGVACRQVISFQKITLADFVKWNPTVKNDCTGMQANVNVCVGIIGGTTVQTTPTPTTSAGNGIQTPQPTQPGMVTNCKKSHYAETGVWDPDYDDTIDLDKTLEMTCTAGFDQKLYPGVWNRTMNWKEMHWWEEDYGTNSDDGHSVNEDFEKLQSHEKLHKDKRK